DRRTRAAGRHADDRRHRRVLRDPCEGERRPVFVALRVIGTQRDIEARRRLPTESAVESDDILITQVETVERTDDIAVALAEPARNARRSRVGDRNVERSKALDEIIASDAHPRPAGELAELGLARTDQDRTADRVAAGQRALRPAQHLDTGDVAELQRAANRAADIDLVDVDAHTR